MPKYYELTALAAGILFALPIAGALYRGSFGGMEVVVAVTGIAVLAVVVEELKLRRPTSFSPAGSPAWKSTRRRSLRPGS